VPLADQSEHHLVRVLGAIDRDTVVAIWHEPREQQLGSDVTP
jgi:ABC-type transporter Mla MlaB component